MNAHKTNMCSRIFFYFIVYFSWLVVSLSSLNLAPSVQEVVRYVNESYIVTCSSQDKAPVAWIQAGLNGGKGVLIGERGHPYMSAMSTGTALVFERITAVDRGRYVCTLGEDAVEFKMIVISPIMFIDTPLTQTAQEHRSAIVKCLVKGDPKPKVLWKFDGRDLTSPKYTIVPDGLKIANVSLEDRGTYTCRAYQVSQVTSMYEDRTIKLNIQRWSLINFLIKDKPMHKRMVHAKVNQVYGYIGGEVNLTCEAVAEPPAVFTWFRPYRKLSTISGRILQKSYWSILQLYIQNSSVFGDYLCKATNSLGTLDQIITLIEGIKPPKPLNLRLRGVSSDTFNIEIQGADLNQSLGYLPPDMLPIGYRIQYRPRHSADTWTGADVTDFNDVNIGGFYIINGLMHNTEYEVRAATRNIAGISDYTHAVVYRTLRLHADSITAGQPPLRLQASCYILLGLFVVF